MVTVDPPYSGVAMRVIDDHYGLAAAIHDNDPRHPKQRLWDLAAPKLLVEEANGCFVDPSARTYELLGQTTPVIVTASKEFLNTVLEFGKP